MSYPMTQLGSRAFNHEPSTDKEAEYDRLRALARSASSKSERDRYNEEASNYIFRENNANLGPDVIDLHGQFVVEARKILGIRIAEGIRTNMPGLHVIVGKGEKTQLLRRDYSNDPRKSFP
jgi:DNA-nicking Smr family endonuclease